MRWATGGMMPACLVSGFLALTASGCARSPDWIEQTLTVNLAQIDWELTLQQVGPKVTGRLRQDIISSSSGPIEGTVNGHRFYFRTARGATGNLQVNGDEMTGTGSGAGGADPATFSLRRQP